MVAVFLFQCGGHADLSGSGSKLIIVSPIPQQAPTCISSTTDTAACSRCGRRVNVCALVRSDAATTLEAVFRRSPQLRARAERWERISPTVSTAPVLYRKPTCLRGRVLLAGDAAGFIDPFAGDGISLALRSGQAAAECIVRNASLLGDACQEYEAVYRQQFAPLIAASTRVRRLVSLPGVTKAFVLQLLRVPGVLPYVIRKTRVG